MYSVISPEGCASILYKDASKAPEAAAALGLTADKLLELGIIDRIVSEGTGSPTDVAANLREALVPTLDELAAQPTDALLQERYNQVLDYVRMYSMNVAQVEQARLFVNGNYVALLILGQLPDENADEAKLAQDEAAKVDAAWQDIFGSASNQIVVK